MPITWRNVESRSDAVGASLLRDAGRSITSGLDTLRDTLKDYQDTEKENLEIERGGNTDTFLDALARFQTEEEFEAAVADGTVDRLQSQFGDASLYRLVSGRERWNRPSVTSLGL